MAGAYTTSAGTTAWVPLTDCNGSTIALVNPASPNSPPATTYTYNPSGMPSLSGQPSNFPFLFEGMENELTDQQATVGMGQMFYTGSGQFYSAQIGRSLSLTGALDTSSPGGPGPDRAHHGGHHGGAGRGAAINGHTNTAAAVADPGDDGEGYTFQSDSSNSSLPLLAQIFVDFGNFFADLFGLGGGGSNLPPFYFVYQARLTRGGRHPQYPKISGISNSVTISQQSAARIKFGDASYYNLPGKTTSSGEPFNANSMKAAMLGVPLGTPVTVKYLPPGSNVYRSINVTVNDHGPYEPGRIIDLTPAAFDRLTNGQFDVGVVPVEVIIPAQPEPPLTEDDEK